MKRSIGHETDLPENPDLPPIAKASRIGDDETTSRVTRAPASSVTPASPLKRNDAATLSSGAPVDAAPRPSTGNDAETENGAAETPVEWREDDNDAAAEEEDVHHRVRHPTRHPVDSLGEELMVHILSYLRVKDLLRGAGRVNRRWRRLVRSPELWRHINLDVNRLGLGKEGGGIDYRPYLVDDAILERLTSMSEGVASVDLTDSHGISNEALVSLASRCRLLRRLTLTRMRVPSRVLVRIFAKLEHLTHLGLEGVSGVDDDALEALSGSCPRLSRLDVSNDPDVSDRGLRAIAERLGQLEYLRIDQPGGRGSRESARITDAALSRLAAGCPLLRRLCVSGLGGVTGRGVASLASLRRLLKLEVSRLECRRPDAVSPRLYPGSEPGISLADALIKVASSNLGLESLNASLSPSIDDEFLRRLVVVGKNLKELFLVNARGVSDRGLEILAASPQPLLSRLDLSWCPLVTESGLRLFLSSPSSSRLRHLCLIRCDAVSDAAVDAFVEKRPEVEFQTFTLGCRKLLAKAALGLANEATESPEKEERVGETFENGNAELVKREDANSGLVTSGLSASEEDDDE